MSATKTALIFRSNFFAASNGVQIPRQVLFRAPRCSLQEAYHESSLGDVIKTTVSGRHIMAELLP